MTVEKTGLWTLLTEAAFQEGTRRSVGRNHPHVARQDFIEGAQWALEQGIVQEMVAALEAFMAADDPGWEDWLFEDDDPPGKWGMARSVLARIRGQEAADDE